MEGAGLGQGPGSHPSALAHPVSGTPWDCWSLRSLVLGSEAFIRILRPSGLSKKGVLRVVEVGGATPSFGDHCCSGKGDHGCQVTPSPCT